MESESIDDIANAGISEGLLKYNLLLMLLGEQRYERLVSAVMKNVEDIDGRVCYVCVNRPYVDVVKELDKNGIDTSKFFFIDLLSAHYTSPEPVENCFFIRSPHDMTEMITALERAAGREMCGIIVFDSISEMLAYHEKFVVMKLTNHMITDKIQKQVKKILFATEFDETGTMDCKVLIQDLEMLADKKFEIN